MLLQALPSACFSAASVKPAVNSLNGTVIIDTVRLNVTITVNHMADSVRSDLLITSMAKLSIEEWG